MDHETNDARHLVTVRAFSGPVQDVVAGRQGRQIGGHARRRSGGRDGDLNGGLTLGGHSDGL